MTPGTGPGRGVPWWRYRRGLFLHWTCGFQEEITDRREGRTVAKVKAK